MAYTSDAVKAKLSSLQDSQDSIVTVAQWIMFHRRYADRTAQLWMERLKDSSTSKRLNLIYLVNEVVQQSKARKKDDFVRAFSPIIVDATTLAFKGATSEVQQKLNRVIAVWRERVVFDHAIQEQIEASVQQYDRSRQPERKARLGGSLLSSDSPAAPPECQPIITAALAVIKIEPASATTFQNASLEHDKFVATEPSSLTPPVLAGRLSTLLKSLASAESSVGEAVKARTNLIVELEKMITSHREKLTVEQQRQTQLATQKAEFEEMRRAVDAEIMRSLENESEPARPDMEPLTPPPIESLTPVGSPKAEIDPIAKTVEAPKQPEQKLTPPAADPIQTASPINVGAPVATATLQGPRRSVSNGDPRLAKRPRIGSAQQNDELAAFADGGMNDIDQDINAMLNRA